MCLSAGLICIKWKTLTDLSLKTWILFLSLLQSCCVVLAEPQRVLLCGRYLNVQRSWARTLVPGGTPSASARIPPTTHSHVVTASTASFWKALLEFFLVFCRLVLKGQDCNCWLSCLPLPFFLGIHLLKQWKQEFSLGSLHALTRNTVQQITTACCNS